jgi:nucleoid DNA-binding protein
MATEKAKSLNKSQINATLAESTGLSKSQVASVMDALDGLIKSELGKKGPGVFSLPGLLKVQIRMRPAQPERQGRNPATGEMVTIKAKPAMKKIVAKPLKQFKDAVL